MDIDEPITIELYNPAWVKQFKVEKRTLLASLIIDPAHIEHIGSTAITGLSAKPIVDIMVGLTVFPPSASVRAALCLLSYDDLGEAGVPERFYFRKRSPTDFNIHAVAINGEHWNNNLLLRDYLIAHPNAARRYGEEKLHAIKAGHTMLFSYSSAKASMVAELIADARIWKESLQK